MDTFKTPVARLARLFQASRDAWKAKALDKQRRLRAAQVKIRDPGQDPRSGSEPCVLERSGDGGRRRLPARGVGGDAAR
jgi:hypothetical protein